MNRSKYLKRLSSFKNYNSNAFACLLSKSGLICIGNDTVQCDSCKKVSLQSSSKKHQEHCEYNSSSESKSTNSKLNPVDTVTKLNETFKENYLNEYRVRTFKGWPKVKPSKERMIEGGWYYTNIMDKSICIHCDTLIHMWESHDDPYQIHLEASPNCYFFKNKNNIIDLNNSIPRVSINPTNSKYSLYEDRVSTFSKTSQMNIYELAKSGFYAMSPDGSAISCFYCGLNLFGIDPKDDPNVEHAKYSLNCNYIKQHMDRSKYDEVVEQVRRSMSKHNPYTNREIEQMVNARLDLPSVKKIINLNFNRELARKVIHLQLSVNMDDFDSQYDLRLACTVMDKYINILKYKGIKTPNLYRLKQEEAEPSIKIDEEEVKEGRLCSICSQSEKRLAIVPCIHFCVCVQCGYSLKRCPICRNPISGVTKIVYPELSMYSMKT